MPKVAFSSGWQCWLVTARPPWGQWLATRVQSWIEIEDGQKLPNGKPAKTRWHISEGQGIKFLASQDFLLQIFTKSVTEKSFPNCTSISMREMLKFVQSPDV